MQRTLTTQLNMESEWLKIGAPGFIWVDRKPNAFVGFAVGFVVVVGAVGRTVVTGKRNVITIFCISKSLCQERRIYYVIYLHEELKARGNSTA